MRRYIPVVVIAMLCATPITVVGTPEAARWHRETLLGEDSTCFIRLVTERLQPGSHYTYTDAQRLERVRRSDLVVVEMLPIREVVYSADLESGAGWTSDEEPLPLFDLGGYLRRHGVHTPWSYDRPVPLQADSAGVWLVEQGLRERLLTTPDLVRRIPDLGYDPRISGQEFTYRNSPNGSIETWYLHVFSNSAADDDDWSEHLLLITEAEIAAAYARLEARLPAGNR